MTDDALAIGTRKFSSRLLLGTGAGKRTRFKP